LKVLLDTHCLVKLDGDHKLRDKTRKLIASASELLVSPISAWEIALLVKKGYLELDRPPLNWYKATLLSRKIRQIELSPDILSAAIFIDWEHRDPADRIIVASAQTERAQIATEDDLMLKYCLRQKI